MSTTQTPSPVDWRSGRSMAADRALLLVRLAVGIPFVFHGASIALGAFGGPGLHGFSAFTHLPLPVAALIGYGELLGGLGVLFGVLTRVAAAGLLLIMLGAVFIVHLPHGYDVTKGGFEYPLTHAFLTLALLGAGPGAYHATKLVGRNHPIA